LKNTGAASGDITDSIQVTDPAHPLFGQTFQVLSISRGINGSAHVFVRFRDDITLRIPRLATSLETRIDAAPCAKLCVAAAEEFLSLVEEYELCALLPRRPGRRSTRRPNKRSSKS
jgi:hypothetical protein